MPVLYFKYQFDNMLLVNNKLKKLIKKKVKWKFINIFQLKKVHNFVYFNKTKNIQTKKQISKIYKIKLFKKIFHHY